MMAFVREASETCPDVPRNRVFEVLAFYMVVKSPPPAKQHYLIALREKIGDANWCELFRVEMSEAHIIAPLHDQP